MGLATFVGQNLGAKQHHRVKEGARFGIVCSMVMAEIIGVLIWVFSPYLVALFNSDPEVVAYGVRQARVISLFYCLLALNHCMAGVLRGAGKATVPMAIMLACWCVFRVTYITLVVPRLQTILVVFSAYPVTWSLSAILFIIYYNKADWLHNFDRLEQEQKA
jgi:Na+-driven multidrug efflux pump